MNEAYAIYKRKLIYFYVKLFVTNKKPKKIVIEKM